MEPTATGSNVHWATQARRVWAGTGSQRVAYRSGGISWRLPAYSLFHYFGQLDLEICGSHWTISQLCDWPVFIEHLGELWVLVAVVAVTALVHYW